MLAFTRRGASLIEILVLPKGTLDRSALLRVDVSTDLRVNDMNWLLYLHFFSSRALFVGNLGSSVGRRRWLLF
jgi:hypothetical protein